MAETLKIKLSVADRIYPLTISAEKEEGLRKAAKKIEQMIQRFEQNYAVRDKQDVLAMCALQFAAQLEQDSIDKENDLQLVEAKLASLDQLLREHLS